MIEVWCVKDPFPDKEKLSPSKKLIIGIIFSNAVSLLATLNHGLCLSKCEK